MLISRAQLAQAKKLRLPKLSESELNPGTVVLDVTVKSGVGIGKLFAPTWQMVMGVKSGEMPLAAYAARYRDIYLAARASGAVGRLFELTQGCEELMLLCFCPDGRFCHTLLLRSYLVKAFIFPPAFSDF